NATSPVPGPVARSRSYASIADEAASVSSGATTRRHSPRRPVTWCSMPAAASTSASSRISDCVRAVRTAPGSLTASRLDAHAAPERNAAADGSRSRLRLLVAPRGVPVDLTVDDDVVVARDALPRTRRVGGTRAQVLASHRGGREV